MADPLRADGPPARLVVVNLDRRWRFATLVRRYALDVFADPATRDTVRFRTLGTEGDHREARRRVWGAQRPQFYGDDVDGLLADFGSDLEDLTNRRVGALAYVVVGDAVPGDPAGSAGRPDEAAAAEAYRVLERMEQRLHEAGLVDEELRRVSRYLCLRSRTGAPVAWPNLGRLLDDETHQGRELVDGVFELRPALPPEQSEKAASVAFLLLRCVMDLVRAPEAAGLLQQSRAYAIRPGPGAPAGLASEGIARTILSYVEAARLRIPGGGESAEGRDRTEAAVDGVVAKIRAEVRSKSVEPDTGIRQPPDRRSLDPVFERLRATGPWWRGAEQRVVMEQLRALPAALKEMWDAKQEEVVRNRRATEHAIATSLDRDLRDEIDRIPIVAGGLSGTDDASTQDLRRKIARARRAAGLAANQSRAKLVGDLDPGALPGGRGPAGEDGPDLLMPLGSIEPYRRMKQSSTGVVAAYRGMVPRGCLLASCVLVLCAVATVGLHAVRRAGDNGIWSGFSASVPLFVAVLTAGTIGLGRLYLQARNRQSRYLAAVDGLAQEHDAVWEVAEAKTKNAYEYAAISRQAFYFDVLAAEIDRRTEENGRFALDLALEEIGMSGPGGRPGGAPVDPSLERSLFRQPVGRWIRALLDSGEIVVARPGAAGRLAVEVDDGRSTQRIAVETRSFTGSQSLRAVPLARSGVERAPLRVVSTS